ncbi:MAG TPA: L-2-hydroxyglutarate oxidase [Solirubrobacteraceae bacterium]|jgi:2-hydroxyglutarate dehydrogenase|nr:L-2-hydroxyglutarate oxidase [Solirubrobacteraceae bacterium]
MQTAGQPAAGAAEQPPARCDLAIVGGGILGLAVARELGRRHPDASMCVLEREPELATHQTGHNSGVIHAGVYYAPGSLKAQLCVQGAREMYEYCEARGIAAERCGKLIVATDASELERLDELERRASANGVSDMRRVDAAGIEEIEPHARGIAALHSPHTGIVDFKQVAAAYAQDVREAGASIVTGCGVDTVARTPGGLRLGHALGATEAGHAVFCAGGWADRLAVAAGADPDPRIVPFRGAYLRLAPERRHLVRALIYPVPDPSLPFLGVHLTKHAGGDVLIGPTALMALARDAYSLRTVRGRDLRETLAWPGTWRMLARWWRTGVTELSHAALRSAFVRAAARYVPGLQLKDVQPAFAGVRAQALARDGRLVDDFVFSHTERALHVRNAPSPAATSSLAIARHVADEAERAFELS